MSRVSAVWLAAAFAALLLVASSAMAQTPEEILKEAHAAQQQGDSKGAELLYREAAASGDAEAAYELGAYLKGLAVQDRRVDAAHGPHAGPTHIEEAVTWLTRAANVGVVAADAALASIYADDTFGLHDAARAHALYLTAATAGDEGSEYEVAIDFEEGRGVAADPTAALAWYRKAAAQGNTEAADAVRRLSSGDDPATKAVHDGLAAEGAADLNGALVDYRRAAALGSVEGEAHLGNVIFSMIAANQLAASFHGASYTPAAAACKEMLDALQKSGAQGNSLAMNDLAGLYDTGICVPKDEAKAKEWKDRAAKAGHPDAPK